MESYGEIWRVPVNLSLIKVTAGAMAAPVALKGGVEKMSAEKYYYYYGRKGEEGGLRRRKPQQTFFTEFYCLRLSQDIRGAKAFTL